MKSFDLRGKDYLTQAEAAHYCGSCVDKFRSWASNRNVPSSKINGKILYRRTDIQREIEREWRQYAGVAKAG